MDDSEQVSIKRATKERVWYEIEHLKDEIAATKSTHIMPQLKRLRVLLQCATLLEEMPKL